MHYSSFGMLALVIHIIINFGDIKKLPLEERSEVHSRYRIFLIGLMVYYVADIFWGIFYELGIIPLAYIDTVFFFASMGLTVFLWMRYIVAFLDQRSLISKAFVYFGGAIFAFQILALVINFFIPIVFHFEKDKKYVPGNARYIMLGLQVVLFTATASYTLIRSFRVERKDKLHHRAVGLSGVVMTIFIILQTMDEFLPFYAVGCLIATSIIHTFVEVDEKEERDRQLGSVRRLAYIDSLTHVKNHRAYLENKAIFEELIKDNEMGDFGIVVFDINDLKTVNDTQGHEAGDRYIQRSSRLICSTFKHSPIYRVGGDEFVAFLEGEDYENRNILLESFNAKIDNNLRCDGVVIASGMDTYKKGTDTGFDSVFERADQKMYENKKELKEKRR
ncbi:MAG: GGDEF domain-containing protein [Lachnospiraceae bacterium]|nr:GGDEF domain-containing protein [Lachnospiraceae bacterium]